jgi:hypothetical protein
MALQTSGQIKLSEIMTEFGQSAGIETKFSNYYNLSTLPASGMIKASDFYGASAAAANIMTTESIATQFGTNSYYAENQPQTMFQVSQTHTNQNVAGVTKYVSGSYKLYFVVTDMDDFTELGSVSFESLFGVAINSWYRVKDFRCTGSYGDGTLKILFCMKTAANVQDYLYEVTYNGSSWGLATRNIISTTSSTNRLNNFSAFHDVIAISDDATKMIVRDTGDHSSQNAQFRLQYLDRANTSSNFTERGELPTITNPSPGYKGEIMTPLSDNLHNKIWGSSADKFVMMVSYGDTGNGTWWGGGGSNAATNNKVPRIYVLTRSGTTWSVSQTIKSWDIINQTLVNGTKSFTEFSSAGSIFQSLVFSPDMTYMAVMGSSALSAALSSSGGANYTRTQFITGCIMKWNGSSYANFRVFRSKDGYRTDNSNQNTNPEYTAEWNFRVANAFGVNNDGVISYFGVGDGDTADSSYSSGDVGANVTAGLFMGSADYSNMSDHTNITNVPTSNLVDDFYYDNTSYTGTVVSFNNGKSVSYSVEWPDIYGSRGTVGTDGNILITRVDEDDIFRASVFDDSINSSLLQTTAAADS